MPPRIGIVTVLYNSAGVLPEFFETLGTQRYTNFILYIVDNKSPDDSLAVARKLCASARFETIVIENEENYGVAKGNNIGIKAALRDGCDRVLLSNNDIVLVPDTIECLVRAMESGKAWMAVPKIHFHGTNKIWYAGGCYTYFACSSLHYGIYQEDKGQFDKSRFVDYAPTCFMLIRKELFEEIGYMDEAYFVYYDDTDFVYRALRRGHNVLYVPESFLQHKESTSTGGKKSDFTLYYDTRNRIYFTLKHYTGIHFFLSKLYYLLIPCIKSVYRSTPHEKEIKRKAIRDGYRLYDAVRPERS